MITIDCGARYGGYHADMTRTVMLGEPAAWQRDVYALVATAQRAGIAAAVPGAAAADVDAAARDIIAAAGHSERFGHGLGHGVGLEIHEAPQLGVAKPGTLGDRVPLTVEPGVYLPGLGDVRIEDTLVVRPGPGSQRPVTCSPRPRPCPRGAARPRTLSSAPGNQERQTHVATTNDLKNGMTLNLDGQLWSVVDFQHVKPGKGGAFVRTKLKNVLSGKVVNRTFNAGVKVNVATVDRREMQYLYREAGDFVFMDTQDFEPATIPAATVGSAANYLLEDQTATVAFNDGTPLYVELPAAVALAVKQTNPASRATGHRRQGRRAGNQGPDPGAAVHHNRQEVPVDAGAGGFLGRA